MDAEAWRQAKGVLAEALSTPPNERDALVAARCPDPDMRREVQAYLNEYDEHFLESVITVSDVMDSSSPDAGGEQFPEIHDGDQIGPYVVLGRLGAGGMGHVFLGTDTRLHRKVALKCLSATASAGELRARILHEARAAARITHPNIAIVHDVVEHESRPFLVMEYVEGENLAALIKRERPPVETIVTFVRQLASALAAAHAKGIVHRDLKPANIQVTPAGAVKILDFGVAHAMSAASMGSTTSSVAGLTASMTASTLEGDRRVMHPGTPAYMSPEQMFGRPIDQRSDIYSLGVIVYEMATGHRPYATDDPLEVVLTLSRNFLRPGDRASNLPAQISGIVTRMLAVRADDRYQNAGELENALIELTAAEQTGTPAATAVRSRASLALRVAAAAMALPLVAAALGLLTTLFFNHALGRVAPFSSEPPSTWIVLGFQSMVAPVARFALAVVALWAIRFVVRIVRLSPRVDSLLTDGHTRTRRLSTMLRFDDPSVTVQAAAGLGLIGLLVVAYGFSDVIDAMATYWSTRPDIRQQALVYFHSGRVADFRLVLDGFIFLFVVAALRVIRLRARAPIRGGAGALVVVSLLTALMVGLSALPYRIVWQNKFDRVEVAGDRCYAIGQSASEFLMFCPDESPPRTRAIGRADASLRQTGTKENIFTPPATDR